MTAYYQIKPGAAPWGDYGDILWNGIAEEVQDGKVTVSRTGPFVPPITLPFGHIIVTEEFRKKISSAQFSGLAFEPVNYRTVVAIDWEGWDWSAADPPVYPDTGEPEGTNTFRRDRHPGSDVAREFHIFWINERMKVWLDENAGQWLSFVPVVPR
jgi:hypothetical protein